MAYKVGDKVVITGYANGNGTEVEGKICVVHKVMSRTAAYPYYVHEEATDWGSYVVEDEITPYVPTEHPTVYPDNNPKTAIGVTKVPLHLVPPSAKHFLALALADGAKKYGPYNWRDASISVSVYKSAAERHLDAFWDGEENAADSGIPHLAHAMACMALMLDAQTIGKLNDDRPTKGAAAQLQVEYANKGKE